MKTLENYLHKFGFSEIMVVKTSKSASIRIVVPKFSFTKEFTDEMYSIFDESLSAVRRLLEVSDFYLEVMDFLEVLKRLTDK